MMEKTSNTKLYLFVLAIVIILAAPLAAVTALNQTAVVANPVYLDGNPKCRDLGYDNEFKIDPWIDNSSDIFYPIASNTNLFIEVDDSDDYGFDWTSSFPIDAVIVKAGDGANVWYYNGETSGSDLFSPINPGGQQAAISHVSFCWDDREPVDSVVTITEQCVWDGSSLNTVTIVFDSSEVTNVQWNLTGFDAAFTAYDGTPIEITEDGTLYVKWDGQPGFANGQESFAVTYEDCDPKQSADVSITEQCEWDATTLTSVNTVSIVFNSSQVTNVRWNLTGFEGDFTAYDGSPIGITASGTLYVKWDGLPGYSGGQESFAVTFEDCDPKNEPEVTITEQCDWDATTLTSVNTVSIVFDSSEVTNVQWNLTGFGDSFTAYDGTPIEITEDGTLYVKWDGRPGFAGGQESFAVTFEDCDPKNAPEVTITEQCEWNATTLTSVNTVSIVFDTSKVTNVQWNLTGFGDSFTAYDGTPIEITEDGTLYVKWDGQPGFANGQESFAVTYEDCSPKESEGAQVILGACSWSAQTGSRTPVTITVQDAILTLYGVQYTSSPADPVLFAPGSYSYTWVAAQGFTGSGSGTLIVEDCTPKENGDAFIEIGTCVWSGSASSTEVRITIDNAALTIRQTSPGSTVYGPYTVSTTVDLPPGNYTYEWEALEDYEGEGSGTFTIISCEPGTASASVNIGACTYSAASGSQTTVFINVHQARLTIDSKSYTQSTTIQLSPGTYQYSWAAVGENVTGSGSGSITVVSCQPRDDTPDKPAGGVAEQPNLLEKIILWLSEIVLRFSN